MPSKSNRTAIFVDGVESADKVLCAKMCVSLEHLHALVAADG